MRGVKAALCTVCLLMLVTLPVSAQTVDDLYGEQLEASGAEELLCHLPPETRALLDRLGLTSLDFGAVSEVDTHTLLQELLGLLKAACAQPLAACGTVWGVLLLYAWMDVTRHTLRADDAASVFGTVCALCACGALLLPLSDLITRVREAMTGVSVFMTAFVPIYGGILVTGGQPRAAISFQSVVLYAAELLSYLSDAVIVPLLTVSLALGLIGSLTPDFKLGRVGVLAGRSASLLLSTGMMLFTGILSFQSLAGGTVDRLGGRALRFSIARFVPVVGGSLSEAFTAIRGCVQALRSTVGCVGVAATMLMIAPSLCTCVVWSLLLSVGEVASELFGLTTFTELLRSAHSVVRCLIGVLCVSGLLLTVSLTVVALAAGGAV